MKPQSKSYKKTSKLNKKKKVITESETGELSSNNGNRRFPIVSLPEIVTSHVIQEYRRFVNNGAAVDTSLTINDLLHQYMFAVTPLLLYCYVRAVRIKKVRILSPVTSQGTSVTLEMTPVGIDTGNNNFNAVPEDYIDTSASIDIPAYLSLTPSVNTPLGSWHYSVNVNGALLRVKCPAGSTLDILFEYIIQADNTPSSFTRVVAGATVGLLYSSNVLTNFVPQGRPSI